MTHITTWRTRAPAALVFVLLVAASSAHAGKIQFKYGGYIKLDAIHTIYYNGDVAPQNPIRDFHIPALIPVGTTDRNYHLDYHVKESRVNFETVTEISEHHKVRGFLELDFLLSPAGDERVSNSFNPRMRHFFFSSGPWLAGQTWTTFQIVVLPDDLDFIGSAEGVVFGRQPQIRFSKGKVRLALENPQVTFTTIEDGARVVTESAALPDVVGRLDFKGGWGTLGIAAIARDIQFNNPSTNGPREVGYGMTLGSEIKLGKDDLKFQGTVGHGLGRYVGLNLVNAAGADSTGNLWLVDQVAGFVAVRHYWSDRWRSTANVSVFYADNPSPLPASVNDNAQSVSLNLLYSPFPELTIGAEYMLARRELKNGSDGRFGRIQFSARYGFGYLTP